MDGKGAVAAVGWLVFWGAVVTGVAALVGALSLVMRGDLASTGDFLIAAALAFGLLANAVYRN